MWPLLQGASEEEASRVGQGGGYEEEEEQQDEEGKYGEELLEWGVQNAIQI